ncbi:hypothetical protein H4R18_002479 [Coemansia javaensis]|uniref:G-protein coupled receptors family 3 profile domain-containing protein n=1 Tax=Coemansia javaensis TaxID=2761396 RepID=A0A9W8HAR0_9FUNG|nr:hypothetical protein H4R18_002479 [Coemansia javaensis]
MFEVALSSLLVGAALAAAQQAVNDAVSSTTHSINNGLWDPTALTFDDGLWHPLETTTFSSPTTASSPTTTNTPTTTTTDTPTATDTPSPGDGAAGDDGYKEILCTKLDCSPFRDWLTRLPNAAANWVLGTVCLVISLMLIRITYVQKKFTCLMPNVSLALLLLFVSLFLRAALGLGSGDKESIYIASVVLNYVSGIAIYGTLLAGLLMAKTRYQPPTAAEKRVVSVVNTLLYAIPLGLVIAGVVLSFRLHPSHPGAAGARCIQTALTFMLAVVVVYMLFVATRFRNVVRAVPKRGIWAALLFALMVLLWTSFMLARSLVRLDNVARTSEVMFGLLNHVPLIACGVSAMVLGQPLEQPDAEGEEDEEEKR